MADMWHTDSDTIIRQRVRSCVERLNADAQSAFVVPLQWYNDVNLDLLHIADPDRCVFGQVFKPFEVRARAWEMIIARNPKGAVLPVHPDYCAYAIGVFYFAQNNYNRSNDWAIDHALVSDPFLCTHEYQADDQLRDLNVIWADEIGKCVKYAATAEGTAIMEESVK